MFETIRLDQTTQVTAPDGSAVRPLCTLPGLAGFAQFELAPDQVARAVSHATVEEIWHVVGGGGQIWRAQNDQERITSLEPGVCLTIPLGTAFQFRAGPGGLRVIAVTVPPWPGTPDEARPEQGPWRPTND
jgi:mannose-6-phosphate isomerase-like protein (cupin superfamily)